MRKLLGLAAIIAFMAGSCGGGKQQTSSESLKSYEFSINAIGNSMSDMAFDTKELKVQAGAGVTINLVNKGTDGAMLHNIVIVKPGREKDVAMEGLNLKDQNYFNASNPDVIAGSAIADPGATVSLVFKAPEAGTYTYICTYPGHWMHMQGVLIVE